MDIGIIGLPQSGKTSLFRAITGAKEVGASFAPGGSVETLPARFLDDRLERLAALEGSAKTVFIQANVSDVSGLISGESGARQISGELLGKVRQFDLLILVLRAFASDAVPHILGSVDPRRDLAEIESELILSDLEIAERRIGKLNSAKSRPREVRLADEAEIGVIEKLRAAMEEGRPVSSVELTDDERFKLRSFHFLTGQPTLAVLNASDSDAGEPLPGFLAGRPAMALAAGTEAELLDLEEADREEFARDLGLTEPASVRVLRAAIGAAGMASFFTLAPAEAHAWLVRDGEPAVEAAEKIHRDIARGFVRAEVIGWEDFLAEGPWKKLKASRKFREEGRDYPLRDGEVMHVRFSA
ncbi:MAG: DUF933 domain-containing protein [Planctomycetota bacterium]|jgi:GTP-binding protein YchF